MGSQFGSAGKVKHISALSRAAAIQAPRRKLLALLILLAFPATQTQQVYAEATQDNPLPVSASVPPSPACSAPVAKAYPMKTPKTAKKK